MENPLTAAECRRGPILDVPTFRGMCAVRRAGRNKGIALAGRPLGQAAYITRQ